jgi:hypothetical protein
MPPTNRSVALFILISLFSAIFGGTILAAMLWKADLMARYGLAGNFYYVALLLFGISVVGISFGTLQSYARYTGKHLGGRLYIGGAIIGVLITVILGFVLPGKSDTFALTVFVHGPAGHQDVVIRNGGEVVLNLGPDPVAKPIGEQGQAFFPGVPSGFRGQDLFVAVRSTEYETVPDQKLTLDSTSVYLAVRKRSGRIAGHVQDAQGNPIPGATVYVAGLSAKAEPSDGRFELAIPGDRLKSELSLSARAEGYLPAFHQAVPDSNDLIITLTKAR